MSKAKTQVPLEAKAGEEKAGEEKGVLHVLAGHLTDQGR